jgi:rhamnulokinase
MQKYAAIDLGAESGRVVVGRFDGERLRLEETHRFPNVPVRVPTANGETLHWDVLRLWNDIQDGLRKAASQHGGDLSGIGVDTWGVDFGLLDERDALLGNPVHYRDARNDGMMARVFETVPREEVFDATGLQFLPFNTLYQLMALKMQNSQQLQNAQTLLMMPDLLHFWLCGVKASEYTIASTSQMLDARTRGWHDGLLQRLNLSSNILPDIIAPGTTLGCVRPELSARLGIAPDVPVIAPGSHDTASAVAAVPAEGENWAYLSTGRGA